MLQPVIGDDDVDAESNQLPGAREAVACDHDIAAGQTREQHGLIPHVPPGRLGMHALQAHCPSDRSRVRRFQPRVR